MAWLARSLVNSLRLDEENDDEDDDNDDDHNGRVSGATPGPSLSTMPRREREEDDRSDLLGRGVKEDLSELKETLTRQLWGVASFLAPPPSQPSASSPSYPTLSISNWKRSEPSDPSVSEKAPSDFLDIAEIPDMGKGILRNEITKPLHQRTPSEISRITSIFQSSEVERQSPDSIEKYDFQGVVGVTEEVLTFATNIALHPETWLDFPLDEEQDMDDFELSVAQREHSLAVEHVLPRLAALRTELCPNHMSEGYFWKVYFVLLHSRLKKNDSELLSTPSLVAAKARWMHELRKKTQPVEEFSKTSTWFSKECTNQLHEGFPPSSTPQNIKPSFEPVIQNTYFEMEKYPLASNETQFIDKSVIEEKPLYQTAVGPPPSIPDFKTFKDDEDDDEWLKDEVSELDPLHSSTSIPPENQEDVSFSDLEDGDDDNVSVPIKS